ncbi:thioredoxin [Candidatus Ruminimicrobium bovinum]|uniref:thioredoxin n=1 Tax=Candidatus Ruminimicrobium bovinum TaxID=3242779 RepID=UPI0039B850D9
MAEINVTEANFAQEVLQSQIPVLVDFWATWCGPCKMLLPVIDEIAKEFEGKVKVCKVNTDENMSLSSQFQITSIPCLIIFKGGRAVHKMVGFRPKTDIVRELNEII